MTLQRGGVVSSAHFLGGSVTNQVKFSVGDEVEWTQHGRRRKIAGVVVAIVPPHQDPVYVFGEANLGGLKIQFGAALRDHVSYLVRYRGTIGTKGQNNLAWPRVSTLRETEHGKQI
jgi:hypothetical protein